MGIAQIMAIVQAADAIAGSAIGKKLLGFLGQEAKLTPEQQANLDANYQDYADRIARLKTEIEG